MLRSAGWRGRLFVACVGVCIATGETAFDPDDACCAEVTISEHTSNFTTTMDMGCDDFSGGQGTVDENGRMKFNFKLKKNDNYTVEVKAYPCVMGVPNMEKPLIAGSCTVEVTTGDTKLCTMYYRDLEYSAGLKMLNNGQSQHPDSNAVTLLSVELTPYIIDTTTVGAISTKSAEVKVTFSDDRPASPNNAVGAFLYSRDGKERGDFTGSPEQLDEIIPASGEKTLVKALTLREDDEGEDNVFFQVDLAGLKNGGDGLTVGADINFADDWISADHHTLTHTGVLALKNIGAKSIQFDVHVYTAPFVCDTQPETAKCGASLNTIKFVEPETATDFSTNLFASGVKAVPTGDAANLLPFINRSWCGDACDTAFVDLEFYVRDDDFATLPSGDTGESVEFIGSVESAGTDADVCGSLESLSVTTIDVVYGMGQLGRYMRKLTVRWFPFEDWVEPANGNRECALALQVQDTSDATKRLKSNKVVLNFQVGLLAAGEVDFAKTNGANELALPRVRIAMIETVNPVGDVNISHRFVLFRPQTCTTDDYECEPEKNTPYVATFTLEGKNVTFREKAAPTSFNETVQINDPKNASNYQKTVNFDIVVSGADSVANWTSPADTGFKLTVVVKNTGASREYTEVFDYVRQKTGGDAATIYYLVAYRKNNLKFNAHNELMAGGEADATAYWHDPDSACTNGNKLFDGGEDDLGTRGTPVNERGACLQASLQQLSEAGVIYHGLGHETSWTLISNYPRNGTNGGMAGVGNVNVVGTAGIMGFHGANIGQCVVNNGNVMAFEPAAFTHENVEETEYNAELEAVNQWIVCKSTRNAARRRRRRSARSLATVGHTGRRRRLAANQASAFLVVDNTSMLLSLSRNDLFNPANRNIPTSLATGSFSPHALSDQQVLNMSRDMCNAMLVNANDTAARYAKIRDKLGEMVVLMHTQGMQLSVAANGTLDKMTRLVQAAMKDESVTLSEAQVMFDLIEKESAQSVTLLERLQVETIKVSSHLDAYRESVGDTANMSQQIALVSLSNIYALAVKVDTLLALNTLTLATANNTHTSLVGGNYKAASPSAEDFLGTADGALGVAIVVIVSLIFILLLSQGAGRALGNSRPWWQAVTSEDMNY